MKQFIEKVKEDKISEYSAQSAYFIILSIIPFTLVFITLVQYIDIDKSRLIYYIGQIVPKAFYDMTLNIIEEIYSKTITTLSISIVFTLWSASRGFFAIMKGINKIYKTEDMGYFYNKFRALGLTLVFISLLVMTLIILVLGNQIAVFLKSIIKNSETEKLLKKIIYFRKIGLSIIIFFTFLMFYRLIPRKRVKFKKQILGSIFVTISWYVLSYGLSLYLEINQGFSLIYGSLTTVILFMIWIYFLIYAIFIGAEINSYFQK